MSQFKQIIGGLLEELAQSRSDSDNFSALLSQQYYEDPLLQHFPVPRMEMGTVHFQMKMAMLDEKIKASVLNAYFDIESTALGQLWFEVFYAQIKQVYTENPDAATDLLALISADDFQSQVEISLKFVFRNIGFSLIDSAFILDINQAFDALMPSLNTWYLSQPLISEIYGSDQQGMASLAMAMEIATQEKLLSIQDEILKLSHDAENLETEVDINADRLKEMPESSITEVSFDATVQNYQWTTESDSTEDVPIQHLLPI